MKLQLTFTALAAIGTAVILVIGLYFFFSGRSKDGATSTREKALRSHLPTLLIVLTLAVGAVTATNTWIRRDQVAKTYRLHVQVTDDGKQPTSETDVWSDASGEASKTPDGWTIKVPGSKIAPGEKLTIYARSRDKASARSISLTGGVPDRVVLELHKGIAVRGVIIDNAGKPIPGAHVEIELKDAKDPYTITNGNGNFAIILYGKAIADLTPNLTVVASKKGYVDSRIASEAKQAIALTFSIVLERENTQMD